MSKFFNITAMVLVGLLSSQAYASKVIKLNPNESKLLTNSSLWTLNATCNIQSNNQVKNKIRVSIVKNKGIVNGRNLNSGQATSVSVKNNQNISFSAEPGTQVNLINIGTDSVQAICA